ncbi:MAG: hypothetical protein P857_584 [Candidatus Xenolissoclinum pacificiensis L6]|uniref:Uncharacterized protein n=1 Tax=Candidatus Xenolissoclinum pacificiensis L6 TaxID=1401685 RepID=W2V0W2_9RICK|nr:MAG: hypothetical protein P857_584 [Candidatus Xenolissoclinum pacificiensis L6]
MTSNAILKMSNKKSIVNTTIITAAMTVLAMSPLTSHAKTYVSAAYNPLMMGGVDIMFEGMNGAVNTNTKTIESDKFDMNFAAFRVDAGMQMMNGIRFGVTAGFSGETTLTDPITFVLSEATMTGNASLPVDVVYKGQLNASTTNSDRGTLRADKITTGNVANPSVATDMASQKITLKGIQDMFIGAQVGYGFMMNRMMPYVDVGAGMVNTTLNFESGTTDAWGVEIHGRIGLNYMISSSMGVFADYTFMSQLETAFDTAITGKTSGVYKMPESFGAVGADLTSMDVMNGGLRANNVAVDVTKNAANNMITLTNSDAEFTAEGTLTGGSNLGISGLSPDGTISVTGSNTATDADLQDITLAVPMTYNYQNVSYTGTNSAPPAGAVKEYKSKIESKYTHHFAIGVTMSF